MDAQRIIDALVVAGMFVVRIGLPLAVMFAAAYWLRDRLELQDANSGRRAENSRVIPFPNPAKKTAPPVATARSERCWEATKCDAARRAQCAAYKQPDLPCWLALQVGEGKLREECFNCAQYTKLQKNRA
ncbi:MAG: hypothetical protein HY782_29140 [Chloroflexi bacterium]|nr:hypothetical protein [Chloroflexota bacterium]